MLDRSSRTDPARLMIPPWSLRLLPDAVGRPARDRGGAAEAPYARYRTSVQIANTLQQVLAANAAQEGTFDPSTQSEHVLIAFHRPVREDRRVDHRRRPAGAGAGRHRVRRLQHGHETGRQRPAGRPVSPGRRFCRLFRTSASWISRAERPEPRAEHPEQGRDDSLASTSTIAGDLCKGVHGDGEAGVIHIAPYGDLYLLTEPESVLAFRIIR